VHTATDSQDWKNRAYTKCPGQQPLPGTDLNVCISVVALLLLMVLGAADGSCFCCMFPVPTLLTCWYSTLDTCFERQGLGRVAF